MSKWRNGYDEIAWNELSNYENVEIQYVDNPSSNISSDVPSQFTKMDYDGVLLINTRFSGNSGVMGCYLKNFGYLGFINSYGGAGTPEYKTLTIRVKKNDEICLVFNSRRTDIQPYTFLGSPYVLGRFYKNRT